MLHEVFENWARQKHTKLTPQSQLVGKRETW